MKPFILSWNNFTPLTRTPWAGDVIYRLLKAHLASSSSNQEYPRVGESWELSFDKSFPSRLNGQETTLADFVKKNPLLLGKEKDWQLLVKLLHAESPLSVQVHPEDEDQNLKSHECGKTESWLVLECEQNAGLYIGFNKHLSKKELQTHIEQETLKEVLQFVPVKPFDYFEIKPGIVHAVSQGVLLLEPQKVLNDKEGKTYRVWDWGRRYNSQGIEDKAGLSRPLHVAESLQLIEPDRQIGHSFIEQISKKPEIIRQEKNITRIYPYNGLYQVFAAEGEEGSLTLHSQTSSYGFIICLEGHVLLEDNKILQKGQSAFLPASCLPLTVRWKEYAKLACVVL